MTAFVLYSRRRQRDIDWLGACNIFRGFAGLAEIDVVNARARQVAPAPVFTVLSPREVLAEVEENAQ